MAKAVEEVTKEALNLPLQQRLALAGFLLESAEAAPDPEAEAAWEAESRVGREGSKLPFDTCRLR